MRLELHRMVPDNPRLAEAWDALVDLTDRPEIFYTYEWARAVSHAYQESLRPWLLLAYEGSELIGVASLAIDSANRACFLGGTTADYCDLISSAEDRPALLELTLSELEKAGIHDIVLANLPEDSLTMASLLPVAKSHRYHVGSRLGYECARVELGSPERRSKLKTAIKKKKSYRYSMNVLSRQGPVVLSHLTKWADIEPALPEFYVAHVARFLATHRLSNIARAERRIFLTELGRLLSRCGWLALSQIRVADMPIAWNFGFRFKGSWFYYQPTFETSLEQYSPGMCLLSGIIAEACDSDGLQIVDLGLGAEGYKERFAESIRRTLYVTLSRSRAHHLREVTRYRLAEMVKRSPRLESSVRYALACVGAARPRRNEAQPRSEHPSARKFLRGVLPERQARLFYEYSEQAEHLSPMHGMGRLVPIDRRILADAVMLYEADKPVQDYLLRAASRLFLPGAEGFVLMNIEGRPIEFYWFAPFEGFFLEDLQAQLTTSDLRAVLIYDVFTPDAARRSSVVGIAALVEQLRCNGRVPWASVAVDDLSWAHALEREGFILRYSLVSRRTPAGHKITQVNALHSSQPITVCPSGSRRRSGIPQ